ncbi:MAG: lamin tail domain-containing protein, partial [Patescibacteria group bacterium]
EYGNIDETPEEYSWTIEKAESAPHLVISEIQIAGVTADDEFIELYNPTDMAVDLLGWSIQYRGGGGKKYYIREFSSGLTILSNGFF